MYDFLLMLGNDRFSQVTQNLKKLVVAVEQMMTDDPKEVCGSEGMMCKKLSMNH